MAIKNNEHPKNQANALIEGCSLRYFTSPAFRHLITAELNPA